MVNDYVEKFANDVSNTLDMDDIDSINKLELALRKHFFKDQKQPTQKQLNVLGKYFNFETRLTTAQAETFESFKFTSGKQRVHPKRIRKNKAGRLYDRNTGRFVKKHYKKEYIA